MADGQQINSGAGSVVRQSLHPLRSRKIATSGGATRTLIGEAVSATAGTILGGPGQSLSGQAVLGAQGAFGKQRSKALAGSVSNTGAGALGVQGQDASLGLSILSYNSNEGSVYTQGRHIRGPMAYESSSVTRDGTLIESADGAHSTQVEWDGTAMQNRVGEYNPTSGIAYPTAGAMTDVFPTNSNASALFGAFGWTSYDNTPYTYFDAVDSLVIGAGGQYKRDVADNGQGSRWVRYHDPNFPPLNRNPVVTSSTSVDGLFYCPATTYTSFVFRSGFYNTPYAYNKLLDVAVMIGGSKQAGGPMKYDEAHFSIIIPSRYISSSIVSRYYVIDLNMGDAKAGGASFLLSDSRASICMVNQYVYWGGGCDGTDPTPGIKQASLFRLDLSKIINNANPAALTAGNITALVERMADSPVAYHQGAFTFDPYSNAILLINNFGVYLYDVTNNSWTTETNNAKLAELVSTFAGSGGYIYYPHAGFVGERNGSYYDDKGFVVQRLGTVLRKSYFFGGRNGDGAQQPDRFQKARSIKLARGQTVSAINVEAEDPANTSSTITNIFENIKHQALLDYTHSSGEQHLLLMSGDFGGWPQGQRADYPTMPSTNAAGGATNGWGNFDGHQSGWYAKIDAATLATGNPVRFKLAQNVYHNYPWDGTRGYFGTLGAGGGTEPTRGPLQPDGIGLFADKRGQVWHGPSMSKYDQWYGIEVGGANPGRYAPMYKWVMPDLHTNGIRLGGSANGTKGWILPSQNRLQLFAVAESAADYDIAIPSGESTSIARPNLTPYDPTGDKCYVVGVTPSSTQLAVNLYSMSLDPTVVAGQGGQYQWVKTTTAGTIPLKQIGLTNATAAIDTPNDDMHNGDIGGVVWCNGSLYFPFTCQFSVPAGYGNATSTRLRKAWILKVTPGASQTATPTVDWIPFPEVQPWFLRMWDGPLAAETYARDPGEYGTTGQYRTLRAVGNKIILGPDFETNVTRDPWICVYDTVTKVWTPWGAPADYAITNGGHDWPGGVFNFQAVPSLGECWLIGTNSPGDDYGPNTSYIVNNGLHNRKGYEQANGVKLGRRIIRFKVN